MREQRLQEDNTEAIEDRGRARSQSDAAKRGVLSIDWHAASEDLLFVRKRAETLAKLLAAKKTFKDLEWTAPGPRLLAALLSSAEGQRAIGVALQELRKAGLASQIADLSVCGAIAPYNVLLGGKLVALAVTSREVREIWRERYEGQTSIIGSQMAGRPMCRPADLKILTTTSLYGAGSSQYNRLRLRRSDFAQLKTDIIWSELDRTAGFGTVHLGQPHGADAARNRGRQHRARRVNNRFGEGTSPRLRQVREGLEVLGIRSDEVLHHAMPRIMYACSLAPGADAQLLGIRADKNGPSTPLAAIAEAWRERWLLQRCTRPNVLDRLRELRPAAVRNLLLPANQSGQLLIPFEI
jgi:hypothetical protein